MCDLCESNCFLLRSIFVTTILEGSGAHVPLLAGLYAPD